MFERFTPQSRAVVRAATQAAAACEHAVQLTAAVDDADPGARS
ncbi:hypothetical protein [Candidatus Frankia alpina]|nr:hypothetical protein [Candidatus Frankia alpina]